MKTFKEYLQLNESKIVKVDIDYEGDQSDINKQEKKFKIKIKPTGKTSAIVSGDKKNVIKFLKHDDGMGYDEDDLEMFHELNESTANIHYDGDEDDFPSLEKKFKVKIKLQRNGSINVVGSDDNVMNFLTHKDGMYYTDSEIERLITDGDFK